MTTAAHYQGRNFDLLAFPGAAAVGEVLLRQELFAEDGGGGEICTGVQMVAQAWLNEFLRDEGSMTFLPERGNTFLRQAMQGRYRTELDVLVAFKFAAIKAARILQAAETDATPDDERIQDATLDEISLSGDSMSLAITITTVAGNSVTKLLPIAVLPILTG